MAQDLPSTLLTDAHYAQLKNATDQATIIQREIDLAKRAGLDMTQAQSVLDEFLDRTKQIKQIYFPGRV